MTAGFSAPAWAKSRWYQVEVIVFRHAGTESAGGEQWPGLDSLPDFRNAVELFAGLPNYSDDSANDRPNEVTRPGPLAFQSLPRGALKMSGVYRRLRNLNAYVPVLHVGWRQPGLSGSRARNVFISDKPRAANDVAAIELDAPIEQRVEGTVQVRTGRLLYVATDFVAYGGESPVRITEQRQVKLKEIHYFDHPLFGVIVQVTPYRIVDKGGSSDPVAAAGADH